MFILKARPISAMRVPSLPRPSKASVMPSRSRPIVVCQSVPALRRAFSWLIRRARSSIRPGRDGGRSVAEGGRSANDHAALFRGSEIDGGIAHAGGNQKPQIGQPLDHGAREGGPLAHRANDAEALQGRNDRVGRTERLIENLNIDVVGDFRPIGHRKRDILVIVKDCAAKRHQLLVVGGVAEDPVAMIGPEDGETGNDKRAPRRCCLACNCGAGAQLRDPKRLAFDLRFVSKRAPWRACGSRKSFRGARRYRMTLCGVALARHAGPGPRI